MMADVLHKLEGLHRERNSLAGRFTRRGVDGFRYRDDRPELRSRLVRLTQEISELELEYSMDLTFWPMEGGYVCPRCGLRVYANECGRSYAYLEMNSTIGCCEACMDEMLRTPEERVEAALKGWKA